MKSVKERSTVNLVLSSLDDPNSEWFCFQAIYDMLGAGATKPTDSAEERAKNIFSRMDENGDGHLTEEEFLRGCLQDDELSKMLAPNVVQ